MGAADRRRFAVARDRDDEEGATLNLWWGCTKVSHGCKYCYAESMADGRFGRNNWGPNGIRQPVKSWRDTLAKIARRARAEERRLRVFVNSMSDTFEGPETMGGIDSENWATVQSQRWALWQAIGEYRNLDFLLLTKRPENVMRMMPTAWQEALPTHVWIGTSVEDHVAANERIPHLLVIPARVRFLSAEPLIGPIDLRLGESFGDPTDAEPLRELGWLLAWVIVGGESGANARPMSVDWARSLRDQCENRVPFFFKQWGEFDADGRRVGKKSAGRLLDGREWSEVPR